MGLNSRCSSCINGWHFGMCDSNPRVNFLLGSKLQTSESVMLEGGQIDKSILFAQRDHTDIVAD